MIAVSPAAYGYVTGGAYHALYASILGAFFLTILLMFVSGLPLQERPGAKKRYESGNHFDSYKTYTERTSILIPFPPQLYVRMPTVLKRTIFLFRTGKLRREGEMGSSQGIDGLTAFLIVLRIAANSSARRMISLSLVTA